MGAVRRDLYQNALRIKQLHGISLTTGAKNPSQWCKLIKGYLTHNLLNEALYIYTQNLPNRTQQPILTSILKACAAGSLIALAKSLHSESIKIGIVHNVIVGTTFIAMYCKCGKLIDARKLFDEMPVRNEVTNNAMIGGYASNSDMSSAMALFDWFPTRTPVTWATMIEGFAKTGDMIGAREFFERTPMEMRTVVTWTVMVNCYTTNGDMDAAREIFELMPEHNVFVLSSMITGYFKKGNAEEARAMFDQIPEPNLVNWNSLIAGYAQIGRSNEALEAYRKMQETGIAPDEFTVASVLSACAQIGALDIGKEVHELINQTRIQKNQFVLNGLIDMYAKCGDLDTAKRIFEGMRWRNDSCWNTMISGLASHGLSEEALRLFAHMEVSGGDPNGVTFLVALSACTHGGLVEQGLEIFRKMESYGVERGIEHYGCLVDLLGRAGRLAEAYDVIMNMPMRANEVVWGAMLGACRVHIDTDMAGRVINKVGASKNDGEYVMLSNIFAASERWEEAERIRRRMVKNGVQKTPGCSSVVVPNRECQF